MSQFNQIDLEAVMFGENVMVWVQMIHSKLSVLYKMKKTWKIAPHKYGFDSLASIIITVLTNTRTADVIKSLKGQLDIDQYIKLAHDAWTQNYIRWKNEVDKSISSPECDNRATTTCNNLVENDRELYIDIISIVFGALASKVMEAGMQSLSVAE